MRTAKLAALILLGGLVVPAAQAQSDYFMPGTSPMDYAAMQQSTALTHINNITLQNMMRKKAEKSRGGRGHIAASTNTAFGYTPSPTVKQKTVQQMQARLTKVNPVAAKDLSAQLRKYDYDGVYKGLIAGTGLHNNDAADALTAYMLLNYMIANNISRDLPPAQARALRAQVASLMAATPAARSASLRAQTAEELKLLTVIVHAGWQSSRKEGTLKPFSDQMAAAFRQQYGLDLRSVKLTASGLRARS